LVEESEEPLSEESSKEEEEVEEEKVEKIAEKIIEGEEVEESEEAPEEYLPEEVEEPLPTGALDIRAIEIMTEISDLLTKAVEGGAPAKRVAEKVNSLKNKLVRRRIASVKKTAKSKPRKSTKSSKKVKKVRKS